MHAPTLADASSPSIYPYQGAFTQGLYYDSGNPGTLVESTGLYGESSVRRVRLDNGRVLRHEPLPDEWFGEGLTVRSRVAGSAGPTASTVGSLDRQCAHCVHRRLT